MTLTHRGGMDIEELPKSDVATVPFDALTGLKAFVVANALTDIGAPKRDHLAAGRSTCRSSGSCAPLRHDDAGAEPDPHAARRQRPADAGGLRLQVRLRPRRPAGGAARAAGPALRRRHLGLRAGGEPAAHPPGPVGRVRHQRAGHDPRADLRRRRQQPRDRGARRGGDHLVRLRRQPALREDEGGGARSATGTSWRRPTCCSSSAASRTTPTSSRPSARMGDALREHFARQRRRRRSTWSSAAAGRTSCAAWATSPKRCESLGAAVPLLRLRQRDLGSGELREEGRRRGCGPAGARKSRAILGLKAEAA